MLQLWQALEVIWNINILGYIDIKPEFAFSHESF